MNPGHEKNYESYEFHQSSLEDQIDSTLRLIGSVHPRPGIEKRIAARLVHAPRTGSVRFLGLPRLVIASAAGLCASVAIVAGSVNHSHRLLPIAPGLQVHSNASSGLSTASATQVAPKPVTPPANGRARSMRKLGGGRAAVAPEAQRPSGVAVPKNPLPQQNPKQ
jgi:hypothetical protein